MQSPAPQQPHLPSPPVGAVELRPGMDLSIGQLVAVCRGEGGRLGQVALAGAWRERCAAAVDYLQSCLAATAGRSAPQLAEQAIMFFQGRTTPPRVAKLLAGHEAGGDAAAHAERQLARLALVYGVTTGFGNNRHVPIRDETAMRDMQTNLLRSHACGTGDALPVEVVRATMLLRVRTFIEGHSAVRPMVVTLLCEMLNRGVHPRVPSQGSVGCSGDLCPLAHLALVLIGEGEAEHDGRLLSGAMAMQAAGLEPLDSLFPKEALALINGATVSAAVTALAVHDAGQALRAANLASAMTMQALRGATRAYEPAVHRLRRHAGQMAAAAQILEWATPSALLDTSGDVQDNYSLRCAPAVHGAAGSAIEHARSIIEQEINAVTDNPLFMPPDIAMAADPLDGFAACRWRAYPAGNFNGEPVGMVADYLKIAVAELASISERRTQYMLDPHHNRGLPGNLWPDRDSGGLNSGLMIAQYTAASLVSENKVLSHPASVDSIPTSSNAEDHNSMSLIAARHARQIVHNTINVIAIELLSATQALSLRMRQDSLNRTDISPAAAAAMTCMLHALGLPNADSLPPWLEGRDVLLAPKIAIARDLVASGALPATAHVGSPVTAA